MSKSRRTDSAQSQQSEPSTRSPFVHEKDPREIHELIRSAKRYSGHPWNIAILDVDTLMTHGGGLTEDETCQALCCWNDAFLSSVYAAEPKKTYSGRIDKCALSVQQRQFLECVARLPREEWPITRWRSLGSVVANLPNISSEMSWPVELYDRPGEGVIAGRTFDSINLAGKAYENLFVDFYPFVCEMPFLDVDLQLFLNRKELVIGPNCPTIPQIYGKTGDVARILQQWSDHLYLQRISDMWVLACDGMHDTPIDRFLESDGAEGQGEAARFVAKLYIQRFRELFPDGHKRSEDTPPDPNERAAQLYRILCDIGEVYGQGGMAHPASEVANENDEGPPDTTTRTDMSEDESEGIIEGYGSVRWGTNEYTFTPTQIPVVRKLFEAREKGLPEVRASVLLEAAASKDSRLVDIFRGNPAWGTMIVNGDRKGSKRIADPPSPLHT